ncbi:MAG: hypothetical protein WBV60_08435, partial [Terriglobales bacterium]
MSPYPTSRPVVLEGQTAASEKACYEMAAAIGEMCGVTHDHPAKLFEDAVRKFHERVIYHLGAGRVRHSSLLESGLFAARLK